MSGPLSSPRSKAADLLLRAQLLTRPRYERILDLLDGTTDRAEEVMLEHDVFTEDPEINPYISGANFHYYPEWTKGTFDAIRFIFKVAFIDVHHELRQAWKAIIEARQQGRTAAADKAMKLLTNLDPVDYKKARGAINQALKSRDRILEVRLADQLSLTLRNQYRQAYIIARTQE